MKKRFIITAILLIIVLIGSIFFILPKLIENPSENENSTTTTEESKSETPTPTPKAPPSTPIVVPEEMNQIISTNAEDTYSDPSELAQDYPSDLIPLYSVLGVSESHLITGINGNPGWNTSYVSNDYPDDLLSFYRPLLINQPDFSEEKFSESTNFKATISGYSISITVSPNTPEKTDLQGNGSVSIFIEQL
jgi:hypothetical protein